MIKMLIVIISVCIVILLNDMVSFPILINHTASNEKKKKKIMTSYQVYRTLLYCFVFAMIITYWIHIM